MTSGVLFHPEVSAGLQAACEWYDRRRAGLGSEFAAAVDEAISRVASNPPAFPFVRGGTRRAVLRRFPHGVHFRIVDDKVVILAIVHGYRPAPRESN